MKTIKEGLNEAYKKADHNAYFGNGLFHAGIKFAQKWIDVNDELPTTAGQYLVKAASVDIIAILNFIPEHKVFVSQDTEFAINDVIFWRPIEIVE